MQRCKPITRTKEASGVATYGTLRQVPPFFLTFTSPYSYSPELPLYGTEYVVSIV